MEKGAKTMFSRVIIVAHTEDPLYLQSPNCILYSDVCRRGVCRRGLLSTNQTRPCNDRSLLCKSGAIYMCIW